ncbi:MAG: hypothetical protein NTX21_07075 [Alphaproteobacteria bacterium]|nr:hypothetical protein [Alphaproteobacteria bacterium]
MRHRAVVIGELARIVHGVPLHELCDLQRADLAVDVEHDDIGFERRAFLAACWNSPSASTGGATEFMTVPDTDMTTPLR